MPQGWSRPHDVDLLADGRQSFDLLIRCSEFPRLRGQLAEPAGAVHVTADFARELGFPRCRRGLVQGGSDADLPTLSWCRCAGPSTVILVLCWCRTCPRQTAHRRDSTPSWSRRDEANERPRSRGGGSCCSRCRLSRCTRTPRTVEMRWRRRRPRSTKSGESNKPFAQLGELLKQGFKLQFARR